MIPKLIDVLKHPGALDALLKWKIFSLASYKIVTRLRSLKIFPETVIDVGANTGQFSMAVMKVLMPRYSIIIEANPALEGNLTKNLSEFNNKRILINGIGNIDGTLEFNVNSNSQVSSFLALGDDRKKMFPNNKVIKSQSIKIKRLDSLLENTIPNKKTLLKIDVQGYEKEVLLGAKETLKKCSWVLIEISFAALYEGESSFVEIINFMEKEGFQFLKPLNFHEDRQNANIIEMDALFVRH